MKYIPQQLINRDCQRLILKDTTLMQLDQYHTATSLEM